MFKLRLVDQSSRISLRQNLQKHLKNTFIALVSFGLVSFGVNGLSFLLVAWPLPVLRHLFHRVQPGAVDAVAPAQPGYVLLLFLFLLVFSAVDVLLFKR